MNDANPSPLVVALLQRLQPQIDHARQLLGLLATEETKLRMTRDEMMRLAWQLGEVLTALKEEVGHGRWLPFLTGQFSRLGERDAQRCMAFFKANPKSEDSTDLTFSTESIRKFLWDYIPVKERPELPGDADIPSITHHLTFVNVFSKWQRQVSLGRVEKPPVEVLRRECDTVVKDLAGLLGRVYLIGLLESLPDEAAA